MTGQDPLVGFGIPTFNHAHQLREAVESLLTQSYGNLRLVFIDDGSTDDTLDILEAYRKADPRIVVIRNEQRLGYIRNAQKGFFEAERRFPDMAYFAWGSDHDVWHPRWLAELVRVLEVNPDAVLAWSEVRRIDGDGAFVPRPNKVLDTSGLDDPICRLRTTLRRMAAGDMVYGLYRVPAVRDAGVLRFVLLPDRLLMAELALRGKIVQVREPLWYRRYVGLASLARQVRASFFAEKPWYLRCPVWLTHTGFLAFVAPRGGDPQYGVSRGTAVHAAFVYARLMTVQHLTSWLTKNLRRPLASAVRPVVHRLRRSVHRVRRRVLHVPRSMAYAIGYGRRDVASGDDGTA